MSRINQFTIAVVAVFMLLSAAPAGYAAVIDDHFDDGDIATNTFGAGSGFTVTTESGGSVSESGTIANIDGGQSFTARAAITSKDGFDPANPLTLDFAGSNDGGNRFRIFLHQAPSEPIFGTSNDYLMLEMGTSGAINPAIRDSLTLRSVTGATPGDDPSEGSQTHDTLADHGLNLSNPFSVRFGLRETAYNIVLSQGGSVVTTLNDTWDGSFALSHITDSSDESYVSVESQGTTNARLLLDLDRGTAESTVTAVPEPASLVLLGPAASA